MTTKNTNGNMKNMKVAQKFKINNKDTKPIH